MVTDQTINDFLKSITGNMITSDEFRKNRFQSAPSRAASSQAYLFDSLRRELLASRYSLMFRIRTCQRPARSRWECFQQLNRRAAAEVVGRSGRAIPERRSRAERGGIRGLFQRPQSDDSGSQLAGLPASSSPPRRRFNIFMAKYSDFFDRARKGSHHRGNAGVLRKKQGHPLPRARNRPPMRPSRRDDSGTRFGTTTPTKPDRDKPEAGKADGADKPAAGADEPAPPADAGQKKSSCTRSCLLPLPASGACSKVGKSGRLPTISAAKPATAAGGQNTPADPADPAASRRRCQSDGPSADARGGKTEQARVKFEPFEKVEGEIRKKLAERKGSAKWSMRSSSRLTTKCANTRPRPWPLRSRQRRRSLVPKRPSRSTCRHWLGRKLDGARRRHWSAPMNCAEARPGPVVRRRWITPYGYQRIPFSDVGFNERLLRPDADQDDEGNSFLSWKTKEMPEGGPRRWTKSARRSFADSR